MRSARGVDGIIQAASGLMSLIGEDGGEPCKVQAPVVDVTTGFIATIAVLAALNGRNRTGEGEYLDVSLFASALALQQSSITGFLGDHELPRKLGSAAPYSAPNEAFPTSDGWIMVAAYMPDRWAALCRLLNAPQLADDERFATSSARVANRPSLREALVVVLPPRHDTRLDGASGAGGYLVQVQVATYEDVLRHPQIPSPGSYTGTGRRGVRVSVRTPCFPVNPGVPRPAKSTAAARTTHGHGTGGTWLHSRRNRHADQNGSRTGRQDRMTRRIA